MKHPVIVWPDPRLLAKCAPVDFAPGRFLDALPLLLDEMRDIVSHDEVAGLAAPQLGVLTRAIVVKVDDEPVEMLNPEITEATTDARFYPEGCLSFPGHRIEVARSGRIEMKWRDRNGTEQSGTYADSRLAGPWPGPPTACRIIQHEIDHLDGVTLANHAGPMQRDIMRRRLLKAKAFIAQVQAGQPQAEPPGVA